MEKDYRLYARLQKPDISVEVHTTGRIHKTDYHRAQNNSVFVPEGEGGEEVEESKWQDRIAYRFDQIISFASTALEDKRRRSDEACNTSPDSGIGREAGAAPRPQAPAPPGDH